MGGNNNFLRKNVSQLYLLLRDWLFGVVQSLKLSVCLSNCAFLLLLSPKTRNMKKTPLMSVIYGYRLFCWGGGYHKYVCIYIYIYIYSYAHMSSFVWLCRVCLVECMWVCRCTSIFAFVDVFPSERALRSCGTSNCPHVLECLTLVKPFHGSLVTFTATRKCAPFVNHVNHVNHELFPQSAC